MNQDFNDIIIDRVNQVIRLYNLSDKKHHDIPFEVIDDSYKMIHKLPPYDIATEIFDDRLL